VASWRSIIQGWFSIVQYAEWFRTGWARRYVALMLRHMVVLPAGGHRAHRLPALSTSTGYAGLRAAVRQTSLGSTPSEGLSHHSQLLLVED
jgi:hypothetical protein